MAKNKEEFIVVLRNDSGTKTFYPDGRVEGFVIMSAEREQIFCDAINRSRSEQAILEGLKED